MPVKIWVRLITSKKKKTFLVRYIPFRMLVRKISVIVRGKKSNESWSKTAKPLSIGKKF